MRITPDQAVSLIVRHTRPVLLLDFDGVLSPIVAQAADAYISPAAQAALRHLVRHIPVALVTGRSLADVRKRAGVRGMAYSGSHGYETMVHGRLTHHAPADTKPVLVQAYAALHEVAARYDGAYVERKKFGLALHYRNIDAKHERVIRREAAAAVATLARTGRIRVIDDKKTFDVGPGGASDKGSAVRALARELAPDSRPFPIYIGDSMTDEDAFRALPQGLTIRVGYKKGSAARYHFRTREEVDDFLHLLAQATKKRVA